MALCCTVCGLWYPHVSPNRLDICPECRTLNFSGMQPALDSGPVPRDPPLLDASPREALAAFIDTAHQITPRQVQAMARLAARWQQQEEEA